MAFRAVVQRPNPGRLRRLGSEHGAAGPHRRAAVRGLGGLMHAPARRDPDGRRLVDLPARVPPVPVLRVVTSFRFGPGYARR